MRLGQGGVGIGEVGDTGGTVDVGLDPSELDQQVSAIGAGHRLLQRAPEQSGGRVGRTPRDRRPGRGPQDGHGGGAASAWCPEQVDGDLLRRGALVEQHLGGTFVVQRPLAGGQVVVDGVTDQRVDEGQVPLVGGEDLAAAEHVEGGGHLLLRLPRQRCHCRQAGRLAQHGDGARSGRHRGRHPAQAQRDQRRDRPRPHRPHRVDVRHVGPDPLVRERPQQLPQQQRVARRHPVAGLDERVGTVTEPFVRRAPRLPPRTAVPDGAR